MRARAGDAVKTPDGQAVLQCLPFILPHGGVAACRDALLQGGSGDRSGGACVTNGALHTSHCTRCGAACGVGVFMVGNLRAACDAVTFLAPYLRSWPGSICALVPCNRWMMSIPPHARNSPC